MNAKVLTKIAAAPVPAPGEILRNRVAIANSKRPGAGIPEGRPE